MDKRLWSLTLLLMGSNAVAGWFTRSCNPQVIRFEHSSDFSLTMGNKKWAEVGSENLRVDIPVTIENQDGCFSQEHGYRFTYEKKPRSWTGEIEAEMPEIEFIDIKDSHSETYVDINHKASPWETELIFSTFVCSKDLLLSVQSYRSRVSDLVDFIDRNQNTGFRTVFATGSAARHWQARQQGDDSVVNPNEDYFITEYFRRTKETDDDRSNDSNSVPVPDVLVDSQLHTQMTHQSLTLVSGRKLRLACTSKFRSIMSEYHVESLRNENQNGVHVEVDSNRIRVSW